MTYKQIEDLVKASKDYPKEKIITISYGLPSRIVSALYISMMEKYYPDIKRYY